ncbi:hypothetical protein SCHPADRAFT_420281 [Schizopora paradoxa]|uniref:Uncharacterized protein n=1 Tax=Schizopora paradoxa TaxID=27342 RepID=A0A0H2RSN1_9AGAM|nr:hypothetical protein SCHPADRAFT_420281 [Schizopora paradoxa]
MCLGNRAESSARYINGQLATLYENAKHCSLKHGNDLKPTESVVEYSTCLFEFYGPGKHVRPDPKKTDLSFYAKFGVPRLEFVCNHEVILFLKLKEGHYDLEFTKQNHKRTHIENIKDITLAYRVEFKTRSVDEFQFREIGNSDSYYIDMHILNMNTAQFVLEHSHIPGVTDAANEKSYLTKDQKLHALQHYLKQYLHVFKCAGLHVLYSLPDYDNLSSTVATVDYSSISKHSLAVDKVFGIDITTINLYLRNLWLQSASYIDDHGSSHDHHEHRLNHYLAEHRTTWTDAAEDIHIHMYTGPLRVRAMCKREVILYLDMQDVLFHMGGAFSDHPHHRFSGWKIAFIVDVVCEEERHGAVKRVKLDISSARYCEHLSFFGEQTFEEEIMIRLRSTLVRYLTEYYLLLIKLSGHHCVFHHDVDLPPVCCPCPGEPEEPPVDDGCCCPDEHSCGHTGVIRWGILHRKFIEHSHCGDFDIVTAVTQGSINAAFKALWEAAGRRVRNLGSRHTWENVTTERDTCIADYSFVHEHHGEEVFFSANFGAPKVQLICSEGSHKVMVYFTIQEGYFKMLGQNKCLMPGSQSYSFSNWVVAFEVELKMVDVKEESLSEIVLKRFGHKGTHAFKQLILDFSTAKLCDKNTLWPGMLDDDDCRIFRARRAALAHYFTQHYFPTFKRAHHHVLYTFPLFDKDSSSLHKHSVTAIKFQFVPFTAYEGCCIDGIYGKQRFIFDRNMVVFFGMVDHHHMPKGFLPPGINWVGGVGADIPHGTVCLSKKTFLDAHILKKLEAINKETTIFATMGNVERGEWKPELTTWKKHAVKQNLTCNFVPGKATCDSLEFHWHNRDQWTYTHDGDLNGNGVYKVKCTTNNSVSVPTTKKNDCVISIKGRVDLSLSYEGDGRDWDAEMSTTWSAAVKFTSDGQGLKVHVLPAKIVPEFHNSRCEGSLGHSTHEETFKRLRDQFPHSIDFSSIHHTLKASFEGCWSGLYIDAHDMIVSKPVFNRRGDLLLELAHKHIEVKASPVVKKPGFISRTISTVKGSVSGAVNGHAATNGHANGVTVTNGHSFQKSDDKSPATPTTPSSGMFSPTLSRASSKTSVSSVKSTSSSKTISNKVSGVFHSVMSKSSVVEGEEEQFVDVSAKV